MPFFSRVFFAIACFFRVIFDGRFAAAVEQTKVLPPVSAIRSGKPSSTSSERYERHAIPPDEVAAGADDDSTSPPSSARARDTIDDLARKTPADESEDDEDSIPPVSTESHDTGLRRRSPPKPNTVPPPPDVDGGADVIAPPTEPSPGTTSPPPSPDAEACESSAQISVNIDSIDNSSPQLASSTGAAATPSADGADPDAAKPSDSKPGAAKAGDAAEASASEPSEAQHGAGSAPAVEEAGYSPRERGALLLLALLQREGRFVDFLQQDVTDFDDEQIGAAARVVHEGCRKALKSHLEVAPIRSEAEGDKVTLAEGYDVQANKLVGNVSGKPPYKGSVQHRGWRAEHLQLPSEVGDHDPSVLAQAEVEL